MNSRTVLSSLGAAAVVLAWNALAAAQTVVVQPGQQQPPPPPAPAPVVVQPAAPAQPSTQVIQTAPPAATSATTVEEGAHTHWRPNRTLLMTGLVLFGAPYVASVGVAATSGHTGDGNLAVPVLGPWLDLGARPGCNSGNGSSDCGTETGNDVLLAADGILQTVGALEIIGSFVFPEHYEATTITTGKDTQMTVAPSRVGLGGYGLSAVGNF